MAVAVMLIHTYYGFNASGGPVGVGVAVGNAVRASLVVVVVITLLMLQIQATGSNYLIGRKPISIYLDLPFKMKVEIVLLFRKVQW